MKPLYTAVTSRHHRYFNLSAKKFFQWFNLNFEFNFSLLNSHTGTMLLQKLATHFLLLNTFLLPYSFPSIKLFKASFPVATLDSPFPWRLLHNTLRSNKLFVHENTLYLFFFWRSCTDDAVRLRNRHLLPMGCHAFHEWQIYSATFSLISDGIFCLLGHLGQ